MVTAWNPDSEMGDRKTDPPTPKDRALSLTEPGRAGRLRPDQYDIKIRWDKARRVLDVSASGVRFDFDSPLKVGTKYPITIEAPGVSISSTIEVIRCQLTLEPAGTRFFRIDGRFFPYVE